jgi:hypothetical protein
LVTVVVVDKRLGGGSRVVVVDSAWVTGAGAAAWPGWLWLVVVVQEVAMVGGGGLG